MKRALLIGVLLFLCGVVLFAQDTPAPTKPTPEPPVSTEQKQGSLPIDVLSDTQGVDFRPYLRSVVLPTVRENWYALVPDEARAPISKKGNVTIEFAIHKDGRVRGMRFVESYGDVAMDRAAYGGISASNPFPPLPDKFQGEYLALRFHFYYNPDKSSPPDLETKDSPKQGVTVSLFPHGKVVVPVGGSQTFKATVTGTANTVLEWRVEGLCTDVACGTVDDGVYVAPKAPPSPPWVRVTVSSVTDPSARASAMIHILQPGSLH